MTDLPGSVRDQLSTGQRLMLRTAGVVKRRDLQAYHFSPFRFAD
ncbi:hypothetical protein [Streptomyces sp. NBC_01716]|nr:hypothetical protein [Streptomyces sp. NBC_01716]